MVGATSSPDGEPVAAQRPRHNRECKTSFSIGHVAFPRNIDNHVSPLISRLGSLPGHPGFPGALVNFKPLDRLMPPGQIHGTEIDI